MSYPQDGRNHHAAVASEKNLDDYRSQIEEQLNRKIFKIETRGGTTTKVDAVIFFEDGTTTNVSLKNKKNLKTGSYDYLNTTFNFKNESKSSDSFFEVYNAGRGTNDAKLIEVLKSQFYSLIKTISDDLITEIFIRQVLEPYQTSNLSLFIIDESVNKIYCDVEPPVFKILREGGRLSIKDRNKNKMSVQLIGIDKDGNKVDIHLRLRIHLNNGWTKWLSGESSVPVIKFQQDTVHKIVR